MNDKPSYNGVGFPEKTVLRTAPNKKQTSETQPENKVSTQQPTPYTPSPRAHA